MYQVPVLNFQDFIAADGETLTTTSQQVAAVFGKRHDHVIRDIRNLMAQLPEDRLPNFGETVEMRENPSGGAMIPSIGYRLTRTGFTLLSMRFTGKKALAFQLAYIDAFDAMAAYIRNQRDGLQYRFLAKELEIKEEKKKVSDCAREMRKWQDAEPKMRKELDALRLQIQPSLLLN